MRAADEELLSEARDPTTPPERLLALVEPTPFDRGQPSRTMARTHALRDAALTNPALPLPALRLALLSLQPQWNAAWYNPIVPALLMAEPRPEYGEAARRLLLTLTPPPVSGPTLASLIEAWQKVDRRLAASDSRQPVRLARHLAGLFSVPWPGAEGSDAECR